MAEREASIPKKIISGLMWAGEKSWVATVPIGGYIAYRAAREGAWGTVGLAGAGILIDLVTTPIWAKLRAKFEGKPQTENKGIPLIGDLFKKITGIGSNRVRQVGYSTRPAAA